MSTPAEVRETHTAVLWFLGDRVHKLKKPVDLGFCDFTTVAARREACEREVALNRRLSPEAYLGVETLLDPDGAVADHFVLMRRMPAERRSAPSCGTAPARPRRAPRAVARRLAAFHAVRAGADRRSPARVGPTPSPGAGDAVLDGLRRHAGDLLDPHDVERLAALWRPASSPAAARPVRRALRGRRGSSTGTATCSPTTCSACRTGPVLLDCLEFDDRLRYVDTLDDAAFLAMDLEHLGGAAVGEAFLELYGEFSGDRWAPALAHHYRAYRAATRAAVTCVRVDQGGPGRRGGPRPARAGPPPPGGRAGPADPRRRPARLGQDDRGRPDWPTTSARSWSPATRCARSSPASRPPSVRARRTARASTGRAHRGDLRRPARPGRGTAGARRVRRPRRLVDRRRRARRGGRARRDASAQLVASSAGRPPRSPRTALRARRGSASDATPVVASVMALDADPWPEATVIDTDGPPGAAVETALAAVANPARPHAWTVVGR